MLISGLLGVLQKQRFSKKLKQEPHQKFGGGGIVWIDDKSLRYKKDNASLCSSQRAYKNNNPCDKRV
jgi:hypothetical protein